MEAYNNMREEGRNAFKQGKKSNTNPYSSVEAEFWFDGFDEEAENSKSSNEYDSL